MPKRSRCEGQFKRREPERAYADVSSTGSPNRTPGLAILVWDEKALIQKETHPGPARH